MPLASFHVAAIEFLVARDNAVNESPVDNVQSRKKEFGIYRVEGQEERFCFGFCYMMGFDFCRAGTSSSSISFADGGGGVRDER